MVRIPILIMVFVTGISLLKGADPEIRSKEPYFHKVRPNKGDGIRSLLKRYKLYDHPCDVNKFLELNNLSKDAPLHRHKLYKIPVYIYEYNGKSIRSTIGIDNWDKAIRIKKYNEYLTSHKLRQTAFTDSRILWVPYHEINCDNTKSKESSSIKKDNKEKSREHRKASGTKKAKPKKKKKDNVLKVALFGEKYKEVKISDFSLKGKVFYITSGHGGPDPGARCTSCKKTMCEDEYAYDIALRLAYDIMQHGGKAHVIIQDKNDGIRDEDYLTCDKDEKLSGRYEIPLQQKQRLNQRAAEINRLYKAYRKKGISDANQYAIFIHVDSNKEHKKLDVYFYHKRNSKAGIKLAKKIRDTFDKKYAKYQKNRGYNGSVKGRGLFVLNHTMATSVFVELGNIRNKSNRKRLTVKENRQAIANWLFEGLTGIKK